jgi:hypothetical protein
MLSPGGLFGGLSAVFNTGAPSAAPAPAMAMAATSVGPPLSHTHAGDCRNPFKVPQRLHKR